METNEEKEAKATAKRRKIALIIAAAFGAGFLAFALIALSEVYLG